MSDRVDGTDFWQQLTEAEAADLRGRSRLRRWRRGAAIFTEGEQSSWLLVLLSGRVKASCATAAGGEVMLAIRGPGALVGELSAVDREPRSATVRALEPVTGLTVALADFEAYLLDHARVAYLLMRTLAGKLRDADRKRIEFGAYDTTGRVAARLVELVQRYGEPTPDGLRIAMPLSQDELASWIGASREAVSKALGVLRSNGWIQTSRLRVIVRDLDALKERAH
jgi:CRP/FNR family transcriptional regulator, cyclic AMP receptor protein